MVQTVATVFPLILWGDPVLARNILIGIAVVLVLLVGAVIIGPSFIDSNALKSEITAQTRIATGRDLTIGGNLEIRFFPSPALTANDVHLSNAEGAQGVDMVSLKAVEVRVALMPLLSGQVQVERIRLLSPVVNIEKFADGRTNLEFRPQAEAGTPATTQTAPSASLGNGAPSVPSPTNGGGMDIRLDNFEVADGQVIYRDGATGAVERIDGIDAALRAGSLNGPFEVDGQARVRGVPLAFEVSLGQIIKERTVPINALLKAPGGAHVQISGAVLGLEAEPYFKGKVKAEGDNLAQLLDSVVGSAPAMLSQTFTLESELDASAASVGLSALDAQLGKARVTGIVKVALKDGVEFDMQLKSSLIDVDAMLQGAASSPTSKPTAQKDAAADARIAPTPPQTGAATGENPQAFAFPSGVRGTVQLTVDTVTLKGGLIRDVRLAAELADGELTVSQMQAMAPGVTDVAVFGFVRPVDGAPKFEGDVEVTSADPYSLTNWLGVALPAGVVERVKRVTYKSKITADAKQVVVSGLQITADKSKLTGGLTLALRKRLSFGANLSLDTINLDTYLNGHAAVQPKEAPVVSSVAGASKTAADAKSESAAPSVLEAAQAWTALSVLNDFDANLKVRVGALTQGGKTLNNLLLDGTLYAGALQLRTLKLGDLQGANASLSGTFSGFGAIPEMSKVKLVAKAKNAAKLAANFGAAGIPKGLKTVALNMVAEGSLLKPRFEATVSALKGTFGAKGRFSLLPIGFGYRGAITAKHGDADALLNALELDYKPSGPLGALNLSAKLNTDGKTHEITELKSTLGDTAINGTVTARTGGAKPEVTADLQTGALLLDRFLAKAQKNALLEKTDTRVSTRWGKRPDQLNIIFASFVDDQMAQVAQLGNRADKRWSRDPFDLSALNMINGEVSLKSDAIQFGDYKLTSADIHATVKDGVLNADKVVGNLFGGPVSGTAIVRANATPTLETNIKLDALRVGEAVKAVAGKDLADGLLSLTMGVKADGLSPADLVSSLAGGGNLSINALDVKKGGKGSALSGVIGLVEAMNQLSLSGGKKGKGLADVALAFDIQDGIANASKMTLASAMGNGSGTGKVDIAGWGIDVVGNMTVEPNLLTSLLSKGRVGRQEVPFSVKGALDNPGVKLGLGKASTGGATGGALQKIDPFRSLIEKALPGVKLPQQQNTQPQQPTEPVNPQQQDGTLAPPPPQGGLTAPAPTQKPAKPTAEDIIKQLMKGL